MIHGTGIQLLRVWLALLVFTAASVLVVRFAGGLGGLSLVLALAMVKARFVVADFMGLRRSRTIARALVGWCLVLAVLAAAKAAIVFAAAG